MAFNNAQSTLYKTSKRLNHNIPDGLHDLLDNALTFQNFEQKPIIGVQDIKKEIEIPIQAYDFANKVQSAVNILYQDCGDSYSCLVCYDQFPTVNDVETHLNSHFEDSLSNDFISSIIKERVQNQKLSQLTDNSITNSSIIADNNEDFIKTETSVCGLSQVYEDSNEESRRLEQSELFHCLTCSFSASTRERLDRHVKESHKMNVVNNFSGLKDGETLNVPENLYKCMFCSVFAQSQDELNKHAETHLAVNLESTVLESQNDSRPKSLDTDCMVCSKTFKSKYALTAHIKSHAANRRFECMICKFVSSQKSTFVRHMTFHTNERLSKRVTNSDIDSLSFQLEQKLLLESLKTASTTSFTYDPIKLVYRCDNCDYKNSIKHQAIKHCETNHSIKHFSFNCNECQEQFVSNSLLTLHMKIHKTPTVLACIYCKFSTDRKSVLDIHMKNHEKTLNKLMDVANVQQAPVGSGASDGDHYVPETIDVNEGEATDKNHQKISKKVLTHVNVQQVPISSDESDSDHYAPETTDFNEGEDEVTDKDTNCVVPFLDDSKKGELASELQNFKFFTVIENNEICSVLEDDEEETDNNPLDKAIEEAQLPNPANTDIQEQCKGSVDNNTLAKDTESAAEPDVNGNLANKLADENTTSGEVITKPSVNTAVEQNTQEPEPINFIDVSVSNDYDPVPVVTSENGTSDTEYDDNVSVGSFADEFNCEKCVYSTNSNKDLQKHCRTAHFVCPICSKVMSQKAGLISHRKSHEKGLDLTSLLSGSPIQVADINTQFRCTICDKYFKTGGGLSSHRKTHNKVCKPNRFQPKSVASMHEQLNRPAVRNTPLSITPMLENFLKQNNPAAKNTHISSSPRSILKLNRPAAKNTPISSSPRSILKLNRPVANNTPISSSPTSNNSRQLLITDIVKSTKTQQRSQANVSKSTENNANPGPIVIDSSDDESSAKKDNPLVVGNVLFQVQGTTWLLNMLSPGLQLNDTLKNKIIKIPTPIKPKIGKTSDIIIIDSDDETSGSKNTPDAVSTTQKENLQNINLENEDFSCKVCNTSFIDLNSLQVHMKTHKESSVHINVQQILQGHLGEKVTVLGGNLDSQRNILPQKDNNINNTLLQNNKMEEMMNKSQHRMIDTVEIVTDVSQEQCKNKSNVADLICTEPPKDQEASISTEDVVEHTETVPQHIEQDTATPKLVPSSPSDSEASLQSHIIKEHTKQYNCNYCSNIFASEGDLQSHVMIDHSNLDNIIIDTDKIEQIIVQDANQTDKTFTCAICEGQFDNFESHMKKHFDDFLNQSQNNSELQKIMKEKLCKNVSTFSMITDSHLEKSNTEHVHHKEDELPETEQGTDCELLPLENQDNTNIKSTQINVDLLPNDKTSTLETIKTTSIPSVDNDSLKNIAEVVTLENLFLQNEEGNCENAKESTETNSDKLTSHKEQQINDKTATTTQNIEDNTSKSITLNPTITEDTKDFVQSKSISGVKQSQDMSESVTISSDDDNDNICIYNGKKIIMEYKYSARTINSTDPNISHKTNSADKSYPYKCDECAFGFYSALSLSTHRRTQHNKFLCSICSKKYLYIYSLQTHIDMYHANSNCKLCYDCGFNTVDVTIFEKHKETHIEVAVPVALSKDQTKQCDDKSTESPSSTEIAQNSKQEDVTFLDTIENKTPKIEMLTNEEKVNKPSTDVKKEFKCPECEYASTTCKGLAIHDRLVHGREKQYNCKVCNGRFVSARSLKLHIQNHGQNLKCIKCAFVTRHKSKLVAHLMAHRVEQEPCTDNQSDHSNSTIVKEILAETSKNSVEDSNMPLEEFACDKCEFSTSTHKSLLEHIKEVHITEKHVCVTCKSKFPTGSSLRIHMKSHFLNCIVCKFITKDRNKLDKHMVDCHLNCKPKTKLRQKQSFNNQKNDIESIEELIAPTVIYKSMVDSASRITRSKRYKRRSSLTKEDDTKLQTRCSQRIAKRNNVSINKHKNIETRPRRSKKTFQTLIVPELSLDSLEEMITPNTIYKNISEDTTSDVNTSVEDNETDNKSTNVADTSLSNEQSSLISHCIEELLELTKSAKSENTDQVRYKRKRDDVNNESEPPKQPVSKFRNSQKPKMPRKRSKKCKYCSFSGKSKMNLKMHSLLHTGKFTRVCTVCQYKTETKQDVIEHLKIHNQLNFVCKLCNYSSRFKYKLTVHIIAHCAEKRHYCKLCDHRASSKRYLYFHLYAHMILKKKHRCKVCNYHTKQKRCLLQHFKSGTCVNVKPLVS